MIIVVKADVDVDVNVDADFKVDFNVEWSGLIFANLCCLIGVVRMFCK